VGEPASLSTGVIGGGFDPVPVAAASGDSIEVIVTDALGATVFAARIPAPAERPPIVVRTDPPRRKTDVPLNTSIVVVFSEPLAARPLTQQAIRLFRGEAPVPGGVRLLEGSATAVVFTPAAPLDPNTDYLLLVSQKVTDIAGTPLQAPVASDFTTGSATLGTVTSVRVIPDTLTAPVGAQIQYLATALDAQGSVVTGRPVAWSSSNAAVATVSASGLVTGVAEGGTVITAEIDGQTGSAGLQVTGQLTPVGSVTLAPQAASIVAGRSVTLFLEVRDTNGAVVYSSVPILLTSSDSSVAKLRPVQQCRPSCRPASDSLTATVELQTSRAARVTGITAGLAEIVVAVEGKRDTAIVTVVAGPDTVEVTPTQAVVPALDTIGLTAQVRDAAGNLYTCPSVTWTSEDPGAATVTPVSCTGGPWAFATVTALSEGAVTIRATYGTASATVSLTVGPPRPVASVIVAPDSASLLVRQTALLSATLYDAQGRLSANRATTWASDNPAVATVEANGLVTAVGAGSASVSATSEGVSGAAAITVTALPPFTGVSAGGGLVTSLRGGGAYSSVRTCGTSTTGTVYCWGDGPLGDGATSSSAVPVAVAGGVTFVAVTVGASGACGLATGGDAQCWGSLPEPVGGGLTFAALTTSGVGGFGHTCGLTTNGAAYCWGANGAGQLGDGSTTDRAYPVAVAGGHTFSALTASGGHTCGLTTEGQAYCWGENRFGQLGNGSTDAGLVPVAVSGGLTFSAVSASGSTHTCGVATDGAAYCWGANGAGQLGDGSTVSSSTPVAVAGGVTFSTLARGVALYVRAPAGSADGPYFTCGVTAAGAAFCWGSNLEGQLGTGATGSSSVPVAVTGGITFVGLNTSGSHTCGVATDGTVYCWGGNSHGQLGDGTTTGSNVPVKVLGQP
jgi:uncharacterized protein YjdB/alpha-tubulin suppressor-like RCC1 family protein